jgi:hypothetical protein
MVVQIAERTLYYGSLLLTVVLLWKIWREGLQSKYRFLALYLVWNALGGFILLLIPRNTMVYFYAYCFARFVQWILDVLITLDLVSAITKRYAGIGSAARVGVTVCLSLATLGAVLTSMVDFSTAPATYPMISMFQLVDRTISFSVLTFLGLMLAFLLWFPVHLSRNTLVYASGFMLVFAARFSTAILSNLLGYSPYLILSTLQLGVFACVLVLWLARLRSSNEQDETVIGHRWNPKEEDRLIAQLETVNENLLRTTSKVNSR